MGLIKPFQLHQLAKTKVMKQFLYKSNNNEKLGNILSILLLFISLFLIYRKWFWFPYGESDDYWYLFANLNNHYLTFLEAIRNARLLTGLIYWFTAYPSTLTDLIYYRITDIFLLGVSASFIFLFFRKYLSLVVSFTLSILIITLPAFQVLIPMSFTYCYPLSILLGLLSAYMCCSACRERINFRSRAGFFLVAILALLASLLIYQPYALTFWAWIGFEISRKGNKVKRSINLFIAAICTTLIAFTTSYVISKILWHYLPVVPRSNISIPGQLTILTHIILEVVKAILAATHFQYLTHKGYLSGILVISLIITGLLIRFWSLPWKEKAIVLLSLAAIPIITLSVNILSGQTFLPYRIQAGLSVVLLLYGFNALETIISKIGLTIPIVVKNISALVICLAIGLLVSHYMDEYYINPYKEEVKLLQDQLRVMPDETREIRIVESYGQTLADTFYYDEYGEPITSNSWGATNLTKILLVKNNFNIEDISIQSDPPGSIVEKIPNRFVIDMEQIIRNKSSNTQRP